MSLLGKLRLWLASQGARRVRTAIIVFLTLLLSIWLREVYQPLGVWATYDDVLFLRLATASPWLGNYDALTLAKGAFFPIFIALNKALGLPLKLVEHVVYLLASIWMARMAAHAVGRHRVFFTVLLVLALSPLPWMSVGGLRITREPLYQSLTMALFASGAAYLLSSRMQPRLGIVLGLLGGCYWLTREEGVWLLPALSILAVPTLSRGISSLRQHQSLSWRQAIRMVGMPLAGFLLVVLTVNSINWLSYGVFRNNELRSGHFVTAYGALSRIKHDEWKRYVVFPLDARRRAYAVSPAARELAPYFESSLAENWIMTSRGYPQPWGCAVQQEQCNDEILSGWFIWALRDAVAMAGHYGSAKAADAYYKRLAREINAACDRRAFPCHEPRNTLAPPWRGHYTRDTLKASGDVLMTLIRLNDGQVGVPSSPLTSEQAHYFKLTINSPVSGFDGEDTTLEANHQHPEDLRFELTRYIGLAYAYFSPLLAMVSLGSYVFLLFVRSRVKSLCVLDNAILILTALLAAIFSRVGLLGFLEATSLPSNNMLYLLPVVPIYFLFVIVSIVTGLAVIRHIIGGRSALAP